LLEDNELKHHWITGSEIAVIRKVKNQIFIICCQPVVKCAGSFSNNNIIIPRHNSTLHLPLEIHKNYLHYAAAEIFGGCFLFFENNAYICLALHLVQALNIEGVFAVLQETVEVFKNEG
jgi:hypothetical protein